MRILLKRSDTNDIFILLGLLPGGNLSVPFRSEVEEYQAVTMRSRISPGRGHSRLRTAFADPP